MIVLNPQWQGWGESDSLSLGARTLLDAFGSPADIAVPVPGFHTLDRTDGVLGLEEQVEQLRWLVDQLHADQPSTITHFAGDCGAQLAPISWLNARHQGDLSLVWVDAHADLNTPESSPSGTFHGMVLRTLLGEGADALLELVGQPLKPGRVRLVGVRALDDAEAEYIEATQLTRAKPADVAVGGPVYIHIDLDSIDPSEFGDVPFPEPDGLGVGELAHMIDRLNADPVTHIVGIGLTESCTGSLSGAQRLEPLFASMRRALE